MDKATKSASPAGAKEGDYAALRELFRPHVESFDYFLDAGLEKMLAEIRPAEIKDPNSSTILKIFLEKGHVLPPMRDGRLGVPLYPQECRQARITYQGEFKVDVCLQCNENGALVRHTFNFGHLPIMLMVVTLSFLLVKWHFPWNNFVMDKVSMLLDFGVYRSNRG